eukprot:Ihof_evm2s337 gene=Ihof_evmTU2s337
MRSLLLLFSLATVCLALNSTTPNFENWAVLVAGSSGWINYRHQADIAHAYDVLLTNGYPPNNIITMMYDDIPYDQRNPKFAPWIINAPFGPNLYPRLNVDYRGSDVTPENFRKILLGQPTYAGSGKTLRSTRRDHVFINFVSHGGVGWIAFPGKRGISSVQIKNILTIMHGQRQFSKLVIYLDACKSGSLFENILPNNISVYATTSADANENSWSIYWDALWQTPLGDQYGVAWTEHADKYFGQHPQVPFTLRDQFQLVRAKIRKSHAQEFGDLAMSRIETIDEFLAYQRNPTPISAGLASDSVMSNVIEELQATTVQCHDVKLEILKRMAEKNSTVFLELEQELQARKDAKERFEVLATLVAGKG